MYRLACLLLLVPLTTWAAPAEQRCLEMNADSDPESGTCACSEPMNEGSIPPPDGDSNGASFGPGGAGYSGGGAWDPPDSEDAIECGRVRRNGQSIASGGSGQGVSSISAIADGELPAGHTVDWVYEWKKGNNWIHGVETPNNNPVKRVCLRFYRRWDPTWPNLLVHTNECGSGCADCRRMKLQEIEWGATGGFPELPGGGVGGEFHSSITTANQYFHNAVKFNPAGDDPSNGVDSFMTTETGQIGHNQCKNNWCRIEMCQEAASCIGTGCSGNIDVELRVTQVGVPTPQSHTITTRGASQPLSQDLWIRNIAIANMWDDGGTCNDKWQHTSHAMQAEWDIGVGGWDATKWIGPAYEVEGTGGVLPMGGFLNCTTVQDTVESTCVASSPAGGSEQGFAWSAPDCGGYGPASPLTGGDTFTCQGAGVSNYPATIKLDDDSGGTNPQVEVSGSILVQSAVGLSGTLTCPPISNPEVATCTASGAAGGTGTGYTWSNPGCGTYGLPTIITGGDTFTCPGSGSGNYVPTVQLDDDSGSNTSVIVEGQLAVASIGVSGALLVFPGNDDLPEGPDLVAFEWDSPDNFPSGDDLHWFGPNDSGVTYAWEYTPEDSGGNQGHSGYYTTFFYSRGDGCFDKTPGTCADPGGQYEMYYGAHPYPITPPSSTTHNWEISGTKNAMDRTGTGICTPSCPSGGTGPGPPRPVVYGQTYKQAFVISGVAGAHVATFYIDLDSGVTDTNVIQFDIASDYGVTNPNLTTQPTLMFGDTPWGANNNERMGGKLRNLRIWRQSLTASELVGLKDVNQQLDKTNENDLGRDLWYHNLNPTTGDGVTASGVNSGIEDKSGVPENDPAWVSTLRPTEEGISDTAHSLSSGSLTGGILK